MAEVDYLDPETWRLRRFDIPIKIVDRGGSFGAIDDESTGFEKVLVPAESLEAFRDGLFPPPSLKDGVYAQATATMPGLPALRADDLTWKAHIGTKPTDPFDTDTEAPAQTYEPVVECNISYRAKDQPPLEITASATGEFIHGGGAPCWWLPQLETSIGAADAIAVRNKRKNIPVPIVVPQTDWSLRWSRFGGQFIEALMIRLRSKFGKVNRARMPILFNAHVQTIMFVGFDYREQPGFTGATVDSITRARFVEITLKFLQKHVEDKDGKIRGHNDFWQEGIGWQYLMCGQKGTATTLSTLRPIHDPVDLNEIFDITTSGQCTWRWDGDAFGGNWVVVRTNCIEGFGCGAGPFGTIGNTNGEEKTLNCVPA